MWILHLAISHIMTLVIICPLIAQAEIRRMIRVDLLYLPDMKVIKTEAV